MMLSSERKTLLHLLAAAQPANQTAPCTHQQHSSDCQLKLPAVTKQTLNRPDTISQELCHHHNCQGFQQACKPTLKANYQKKHWIAWNIIVSLLSLSQHS
jgi:hypothetical protein